MNLRVPAALACVMMFLLVGWAQAGPYSIAVLADTPEAYWRLNETTGTNTTNDAANNHDFAYYNTSGVSPTRTGNAPDVGPRPSAFGGFESDNNAPTLTGAPHGTQSQDFLGIAGGVLSGQNNYTFEMWFRPGIDQNVHGDFLMHRKDPNVWLIRKVLQHQTWLSAFSYQLSAAENSAFLRGFGLIADR